jgi:phosphatidylglycerol:prolipoprotein diacylglycerol transferase
MHRILFTLNLPFLGPLDIYTYGAMMAVAFVVALVWMLKYSKPEELTADDVMNFSIYLICFGVVGARLLHVLINLDYFSAHPLTILNLRSGGLAWYGAVFGGIIAAIIFARGKKISFWKIADMSSAPVTIGLAIGRMGCFLNGCCYGKPTDVSWGVNFPTMPGGPRHPTQLYESFMDILVFFILNRIDKKKTFNGETFCYFISFCGIVRFVNEFFREWASPVPYFLGLNVAQFITLSMTIASLIIAWKLSKKKIVD